MKIYTTETVYHLHADRFSEELNKVIDRWERHELEIQYSTSVNESAMYFTALVIVKALQP